VHVLRELLHHLPGAAINNALNDGCSIWVGGKVSNARHVPMFSKLAVPFLPNNPPRWPEVVAAVKNIVEVWAADARKFERMGEWIERIGWPASSRRPASRSPSSTSTTIATPR